MTEGRADFARLAVRTKDHPRWKSLVGLLFPLLLLDTWHSAGGYVWFVAAEDKSAC